MARPSKNNADYFSHDCDMRNDIKIKALRRKFGHKGYAVWCFMLETLTDSEDFFIEYNEISQELMAADFDVSVEELKVIIDFGCRINLLQLTDDSRLFSQSLQRRFEDMIIKREKRREINRQNGAKGGNPNFKKGKPNPYYIGSEDNQSVMSNNQKISEDNSKVKKSKVKESKVIKETPNGVKKTAQRFSAPTIDEVRQYAQDNGYSIDADHFVDYYTSNGWKVGRSPMKDWKASVRTWASRDRAQGKAVNGSTQSLGLGVGEYITQDGRRTYGSGRANIPLSAPPRPSEQYSWSAESNSWIII